MDRETRPFDIVRVIQAAPVVLLAIWVLAAVVRSL